MSGSDLLRSPKLRVLMLLGLYAVTLLGSYWLAYQIRFDFHVESPFSEGLSRNLRWAVPAQLVLLYVFRQFAGLLSYFSVPDMRRLAYSTSLSALLLLAMGTLVSPSYMTP